MADHVHSRALMQTRQIVARTAGSGTESSSGNAIVWVTIVILISLIFF